MTFIELCCVSLVCDESVTCCHWLQWRAVARELFGVIRIGAVNCEDDWVLCRQKGIQSYPTLILYPEVLCVSFNLLTPFVATGYKIEQASEISAYSVNVV